MSNPYLDPLDSEINSLSKAIEIQEITPWEICAKVVGGLMITVFAGLALVTILQATGAISLPHSMEWIILAAEGSWPQLLGVVATTVGGCAIGILAIVYGTPKKPQQISLDDNEAPASSPESSPKKAIQYENIWDYLWDEVEENSYWSDPHFDPHNPDSCSCPYFERIGNETSCSTNDPFEISRIVTEKNLKRHEVFFNIEREYVQGLWQDGLPADLDSSCFVVDWQDEMAENTYFRDQLGPGQTLHTFIFKTANKEFKHITPLSSEEANVVEDRYLKLNFPKANVF